MRIFTGIKKYLRILGFLKYEHPNAKIEKAISIFQKIVLFCGSPLFISSPIRFFLFRAETFFDKTYSISIFILAFATIAEYWILIWKREQLLELFTQFESKISERNIEQKAK